MLHKNFGLQIKGIDETGYIEGLAAGYGNIDLGGDRILPGALGKSVEGRSGVPMLLYHDTQRPIGKWTEFRETDEGLVTKGRIAVKTRDGGEAYELVSVGALEGLSIGYEPLVKRMAGKVRELVELALHEVSLVTIGMNPKALITDVKDNDAFTRLLAGVRPQQRELEGILKHGFGVSNAEAERMANALLGEDRGGRDATAESTDFWSAMAEAEIIDLTGE